MLLATWYQQSGTQCGLKHSIDWASVRSNFLKHLKHATRNETNHILPNHDIYISALASIACRSYQKIHPAYLGMSQCGCSFLGAAPSLVQLDFRTSWLWWGTVQVFNHAAKCRIPPAQSIEQKHYNEKVWRIKRRSTFFREARIYSLVACDSSPALRCNTSSYSATFSNFQNMQHKTTMYYPSMISIKMRSHHQYQIDSQWTCSLFFAFWNFFTGPKLKHQTMTQKARCLSWWQILLLGFLSRTWLILGFYSGCKTANTTPSLQLRRRSSQCSPWNQYTFCGICTSPRMIWLRKPQCHTPTKFQLGLTCLWKRCFGLMFIVLCCVNDVPRIQYADLFYLVLIANVATTSETKKPWTPTASHH